ncbi:metallophosphoesterase family protein [Rapidithrix thailandica]|uniref:Metallophosphoesterase family protein n=1 Tax=Rapidithrix thailandica TaxID=413964 RepID=A0AAW9SEF2_9BACT
MKTPTNSTDRRSFLRKSVQAGLMGTAATCLPTLGYSTAHLTETPHPEKGHVFLTTPYLQSPEPTAMTVMWITNQLSYSWVEFGESQSLGSTVHEVKDGLVSAYNRINCIVLKGLKPGKKYYYRIFSKAIEEFQPYKLTYGETIQSEVLSFTTPDPSAAEVSWLVMNDIHDRPHSIPHLMKLNQEDPFDYVFYNGDMFDYQVDEQQMIDHMLVPSIEVFASEKPFMFVRGNHETRGKFARGIHHYYRNPSGQQYYAYQWGPVHFTVFDTGEDKPDDHPVYAGIVDFDSYREEQAKWFEETVVKSAAYKKAKFRVVMMHIPIYYSGDWHGTSHCRTLFSPLFNKYKVDICLSGHTHKYGVHPPVAGQHNYPIIIGGGPKEGNRTLIKVKANQKQLELRMLRDDGEEVGSYQLPS